VRAASPWGPRAGSGCCCRRCSLERVEKNPAGRPSMRSHPGQRLRQVDSQLHHHLALGSGLRVTCWHVNGVLDDIQKATVVVSGTSAKVFGHAQGRGIDLRTFAVGAVPSLGDFSQHDEWRAARTSTVHAWWRSELSVQGARRWLTCERRLTKLAGSWLRPGSSMAWIAVSWLPHSGACCPHSRNSSRHSMQVGSRRTGDCVLRSIYCAA